MKEKIALMAIHNSPIISVEELAGLALIIFAGAVVIHLLMERKS